MEHWLEQEIAQWVHPMKDRSDDPRVNALTTELHLTPALFVTTVFVGPNEHGERT